MFDTSRIPYLETVIKEVEDQLRNARKEYDILRDYRKWQRQVTTIESIKMLAILAACVKYLIT